MVNACRVGTSICEMLNRTRSIAIAHPSLGISGTRISSTLEGMCVNTMVLSRPNFLPNHAAESAERPARILAPKKIPPSMASLVPKRT